MDERKREEAEFHDRRERDRHELGTEEFERRYSNKKFYSVVRRSTAYLQDWLRAHAPGRRALDYCCGLGEVSLDLARNGATVFGMDISEESIRTARAAAADAGLAERAHFSVGDAERLAFSDATFDLIVVSGVLHHLDVQRAYPELARVLRPDGRILCLEAAGHNPVINLYRRRTPHLRTAWEAEHILTLREVNQARLYFGEVRICFFHLFSIAAVPFRRTRLFAPILTLFEALDAVVLRLPWVRRFAWQMFFELRRPIR
jgi:ubiquinone/menaquinone biosynthesis C-methylase UbiE